jgi:vacuolar-type H+-ATPase subunit E/Vma4
MKQIISFEEVVLKALAVLLSDAYIWADAELSKELREARKKYIDSTLKLVNEYLKEIETDA